MVQLYHHPFCPQSRFIRICLGEYGIEPSFIEERVHERRPDFLTLNPAGHTPVYIDDVSGTVAGASVIAEYLDEVYGLALGDHRLLPENPKARIEVRRLVEWFNVKFFNEVSQWLVQEKIYKRHLTADQGGGAPNMDLVRAARANIRYHIRYIGWLMSQRNWLAGDKLSYADLVAAAHLSSIDYLGDVPWGEDDLAKTWYARVKSRPSFRPLLADRINGLAPAPAYTDLDF
jgi:glutathione S-transferase